MPPRIVTDWIEPFRLVCYRKPASWAAHLRPAASAAWTAPTTGPLDAGIERAHARLDELFPDERRHIPIRDTMPAEGLRSWSTFFRRGDTILKRLDERHGSTWLRAWGLRVAENWSPAGPVGGWAFQFHDAFYPDVDDTAMVMLALRQADLSDEETIARERACLRGLH
jgi:hypothetical protein